MQSFHGINLFVDILLLIDICDAPMTNLRRNTCGMLPTRTSSGAHGKLTVMRHDASHAASFHYFVRLFRTTLCFCILILLHKKYDDSFLPKNGFLSLLYIFNAPIDDR